MKLLAEIRARTSPMHVELETVLNIPEQVKTRAQYAALLAHFLALYEPWEASLASHGDAFARLGIQLPARLRVPKLRSDLETLSDVSRANFQGPKDAELAFLQDFPGALGSLYVLEGSTLGGQVLVRHFREHLELPPEALQFFHSHGPQVGKMWKDFCAGLLAFEEAASDEDCAAVISAAASSFRLITRAFSPAKP